MRLTKLLAVLWLLPFFAVVAQNQLITVTGTLKGSDGEPIPGVSVSIKGTDKGTVTDIHGNYQLKAPLGSVLVFSFVGMKTREATVTLNGLLPQNSRIIIPYNKKPEVEPDRSAEQEKLRRQTAYAKRMERYRNYLETPIDTTLAVATIGDAPSQAIKKAIRKYDNTNNPNYSFGIVEFNTSLAINPVGRLPKLQRTFAQGRPQNGQFTYRGPDTGEPFSWGPRLANLEYDGLATDYDPNGSLVTKGNGNGKAAKAYQSQAFLKPGFTNRNDLTLHQRFYSLKTDLNLGHMVSQGNLPGSTVNGQSVSLKATAQKNFDAWVRYQHQDDDLQNRLWQSKILYSGLITPPSFDNANGLSAKEANRSAHSIYTSMGQVRSFFPGHIDNPFYLTQNLQNPSEQNTWAGQATVKFEIGNMLRGSVSAGGEWSANTQRVAMQPASNVLPANYIYQRHEQLNSQNLAGNLDFSPGNKHWNWRWASVKLPFRIEGVTRDLTSKESISIENETKRLEDRRRTFTASPIIKADFDNRFILSATGNIYSSSTADKTYVTPSLGMAVKPFELIDHWFFTDIANIGNFRVSANYSQMPVEYNLMPEHGMANSLLTPSSHFALLTETIETVPSPDIVPEMLTQQGLNVEVNLWRWITAEFNLYAQTHKNAIFPVVGANNCLLKNMADYKTNGWEATLSINNRRYGNFRWDTRLVASRQRSEVTWIDGNGPVALSGFADVNTALVKGQPLGVIMGRSYLTNANGQTVIGPDGFPMVDNSLKVIGKPAPKLRLGMSNNFGLFGFDLSFLVDARVGGQIWNGTRSTLDYYGVSSQTGKERYTLDYIFDGVDPMGQPNKTMVDFAPRNGNVFNNRWTRYGQTGVAKAYIEDATQVVLREVSLGYTLNRNTARDLRLNHLKLSVFATNIAAIAGYKGVVPDNTLWGHISGQGLDYFNTPLPKSIGFKLETKF